jgi:MFS family permease
LQETVHTFTALWVGRSLTGLGVGGIYPLTYSLISDIVTARERAAAAAWVGLAEGVGMAAGTLLAGNLGTAEGSLLGSQGWRLPFVLAALPNFALVPLFWIVCQEPARGGGEEALQSELEQGLVYNRRIKLSDYKIIFSNRTNIYFILQSIPGTIGWGMLPFWMIDYYHDQKGVSIPLATNLMIVVGLGMIAGGFVGGLVGNWLHRKNPRYLPLLCGFTTLMGMAGFFVMINYPVPTPAGVAEMLGPLVVGVVAGFFITITSSNIRAIVLNVNPPENRGGGPENPPPAGGRKPAVCADGHPLSAGAAG